MKGLRRGKEASIAFTILDQIDLIYEGIETFIPSELNYSVRIDQIDLIYEGIETLGVEVYSHL